MKFFLQSPKWGETTILRQSEYFSGHVSGAQWSPMQQGNYDWLLCEDPDKLPANLKSLGRDQRVFVMAENPKVWRPAQDYLEQFGVVISPFELQVPNGVRFIQTQPSIAWFYGIAFQTNCGLLHKPTRKAMELSEMRSRFPRPKSKLISCIVSGKAGLPGHQWRIAVAQELKATFGSKIDLFGFGHQPIADKAEALDDYIFTVVIENDSSPHYWTEKLADSLIAGCIPIYSGASLVSSYFPFDFPQLQFGCNPKRAVQDIKRIVDAYSPAAESLHKARDLILGHYNILCYLPHLLESM
jgi:hypothetical protein